MKRKDEVLGAKLFDYRNRIVFVCVDCLKADDERNLNKDNIVMQSHIEYLDDTELEEKYRCVDCKKRVDETF